MVLFLPVDRHLIGGVGVRTASAVPWVLGVLGKWAAVSKHVNEAKSGVCGGLEGGASPELKHELIDPATSSHILLDSGRCGHNYTRWKCKPS